MSRRDDSVIVQPGDFTNLELVEFDIREYKEHFRNLVQLEREEEMKRHEEEIKRLSGIERQKKGRALLDVRARDEGTGLGGKTLVKFVKKKGIPETEISVGDLVRVSKDQPLSDDNPSGTVTEKTNYSLTAAFDDRLPRWIFDRVRVDLYVNDITYQRMLDAIERIDDLEGKKRKLIDQILSKQKLDHQSIGEYEDVRFFNCDLNNSQKRAVERSMESDHLHLIHGPPGTGKTITCIEVIEQAIAKGDEVLACADSNTAVDNIVEDLVLRGKDVVRVGHPARVTSLLREYTLDYLLEENSTFKRSQELRERVYDLKDEQENYTFPSGRWRRGLSNEAIKSLAEKRRGSRGVPPDKIKEMAKSLEIQEEVDELFEKIEHLEDKAVEEILDDADVVCSTNSTSASQVLEDRDFDLCVIDEATQATEPSCLIPLIKAGKVIMAGDHKQLPPTILNREAEQDGLSDTLFERLVALYGSEIKTLLKTQYRMHQKIMKFSDEEFYEGQIKASETVKDHTLKDLKVEKPDGKYRNILDVREPIVLIDTAGEMPERDRYGSSSKENLGEAVLAERLTDKLIEIGVDPRNIGIITPYNDQKDLIRKKIDDEDIEVDTVDGFQGREKEVIILSLTRSNIEGDIGFLKDLRRLNVSLTRAKRKLIVIGDSNTLCTEEIYIKLETYIEKEGEVVRVKEAV